MKPMKMAARLSSFFLLDSLTVTAFVAIGVLTATVVVVAAFVASSTVMSVSMEMTSPLPPPPPPPSSAGFPFPPSPFLGEASAVALAELFLFRRADEACPTSPSGLPPLLLLLLAAPLSRKIWKILDRRLSVVHILRDWQEALNFSNRASGGRHRSCTTNLPEFIPPLFLAVSRVVQPPVAAGLYVL